MDQRSDESLVQAAQSGDATALACLYDRYLNLIFAYLRRRVDTAEAAEDLTSETFLAVVKTMRSFRNESSFRTWVFDIARRRLADYWRRAYRLPTQTINVFDALAAPSTDNNSETGSIDQRQAQLQTVLKAMPERERRVLQCRFLEGRTVRETADALELTETNAKVIQHRAIARAARLSTQLCPVPTPNVLTN